MTDLAGRGIEWVIEAAECDPARLASEAAIRHLLDEVILAGALRAVGDRLVHQFPAPGGVTGLVLLAESHLAVHTFPEHASLCLNLFCCVPRPSPDWVELLGRCVGARSVAVRRLERSYGPACAPCASWPGRREGAVAGVPARPATTTA